MNIKAIEDYLANPASSEIKLVNVSPELAKSIQSLLIHYGLLTNSKADGIVGAKTLAAFAAFKQKEYLNKPDVFGRGTAAALLEGYREHPLPTKSPGEKVIILPNKLEVYASMPVYPNSNFTWGEMTAKLTRIPNTVVIVNNIISLAKHLDKVRSFLGNRSITINSAYRPPAVNKAVGGVSSSRHIVGDAADIVVAGLTPFQVYDKLDSWHGNVGGLGKSSVFTHIDMRGYKARFKYGR